MGELSYCLENSFKEKSREETDGGDGPYGDGREGEVLTLMKVSTECVRIG